MYPNVEVSTTDSGKEALQIIEKKSKNLNPIDLVVSDIKMPEVSGIDLARKVIAEYPHISIILMTAYDLSEMEEEAKHFGISKIIYKSMGFKKVVKEIHEWAQIKIN